MLKKQKSSRKRVLFNASVIIAAHYSTGGGSAKLLSWVKSKRIDGLINETTQDEVHRHIEKCPNFFKIVPVPNPDAVKKFQKIVTDPGDAHLFATAHQIRVDFLVSLDKKHILILQNKIKKPKIVSPGEFIELTS